MPASLQLVADPPFAQVAAMPTDPGSTFRTCSVEHGVGTFVATRVQQQLGEFGMLIAQASGVGAIASFCR